MHTYLAKFTLGDLVRHDDGEHRGVVVDVDPTFEGPEEWVQGEESPSVEQPWYSLLLDNSEQMAYVAEEQLEPDDSEEPVNNPATESMLGELHNGRYEVRQTIN